MRKIIIKVLNAGIFCFSVLTIFAQADVVRNKELIIGKNYLTNQNIKAKEYIFQRPINEYFIDTTANILILELRKKASGLYFDNSSNIVLYDLAKRIIRWDKKTHYNNGGIQYLKRGVIQTTDSKTSFLSIKNGENKWKVESTIFYIDPLQEMGIGFKLNNPYANNAYTWEGIDMKTGFSMWERKIKRNYNLRDVSHLNDSEIVIAGAGLHLINLKNGKGWDYNTYTGQTVYTGSKPKSAGAALASDEETLVTSTGNNLRNGVVSNILVDSTAIYFASKDKITSLDHKGSIKWSMPLTNNLASKPFLFIKDSMISIINKGSVYAGNKQLFLGTPFIASFNKYTGKHVYFNSINSDQISDYVFDNDTILLIFKDRMAKYSMKNGSVILEKLFDSNSLGELKYLMSPHFYSPSGTIYTSLASVDAKQYFLFTDKDKVLVLNKKLDVLKQLDYNQLYTCQIKTKDCKFLTKNGETVVIDNENRKVADMNVSGDVFLIGSTLYDVKDKSILEIEIPDLIKN